MRWLPSSTVRTRDRPEGSARFARSQGHLRPRQVMMGRISPEWLVTADDVRGGSEKSCQGDQTLVVNEPVLDVLQLSRHEGEAIV